MGNIARVVPAVSLYFEPLLLSDGPDARLAADFERMARSRAMNEALAKPGQMGNLDVYNLIDAEDKPATRPVCTIRDIRPKSYKFIFNSFRHADEFEVTIPLALIPFPPTAIRNMTVEAVIRHVQDYEWDQGIMPTTNVPDDQKDFVGVLKDYGGKAVIDGQPCVKLVFFDYLGLLSSKHVESGKEFDQNMPISKCIEKFLVGTWGEGLGVEWIDEAPEPTPGAYVPTLHHKKKRAKNAKTSAPSKPTNSKETYLEAIVKLCHSVGVVPVVAGKNLTLAYAGTLYTGQKRKGPQVEQAELIVSDIIESIDWDFDPLGKKYQSIQVTSWNPYTHKNYVARWPPDPKKLKAEVLGQGTRPNMPPIVANLGRPGFEMLDDSVLSIPVAPTENPELLPKLAEAIFFERSRQTMKIKVRTHSPFSDPFSEGKSDADLLRLRSGDNVKFGFFRLLDREERTGLTPVELRTITNRLGQKATAELLIKNGMQKQLAEDIALAIDLIPSTDLLRVDAVSISGSDKSPCEIELTMVTFTIITSDLQNKAYGKNPDDIVTDLLDSSQNLQGKTKEQIKEAFAKARSKIDDSDAPSAAKDSARKRLDLLEKQALK